VEEGKDAVGADRLSTKMKPMNNITKNTVVAREAPSPSQQCFASYKSSAKLLPWRVKNRYPKHKKPKEVTTVLARKSKPGGAPW